jgi:PAS domain S-box-containing protein
LYFSQLEPRFLALKDRLDDLLHLNQQAMLRANDMARAESWRAQVSTAVIATVALLLALLFAWRFTAYIVRPISALTQKAKRIAEGDFDQHVDIVSQDEIGVLAAEFNRMSIRLRELRQSDYWRILIERKKSDAVIDSIFEPVIVTDARGHVIKLNQAATHLFGETSEDGKESGETLALAGFSAGQRILKAVEDAVALQRPVAAEGEAAVVPFKVGGAERSYRLRTTPMRDSDGRLLGAVSVLEDITSIREVDRLKTEFISIASSKLRAPLRSLQLALYTLAENSDNLTEKQQDLLYGSRQDAEQLDELMTDLLELAEIESGTRQLSPESLRPVEVVRSVVEQHRPAAESKHIKLEHSLSPDLPRVIADRGALKRILDNLLSNAIRHTGRDGHVTVSATEREDRLIFSVTDTGTGIPPEFLPTLFSRFVHVQGTPAGGTGLGLAIVKRLVEAQGGQVGVESRVGEGTTFTFTLPVAVPADRVGKSFHEGSSHMGG